MPVGASGVPGGGPGLSRGTEAQVQAAWRPPPSSWVRALVQRTPPGLGVTRSLGGCGPGCRGHGDPGGGAAVRETGRWDPPRTRLRLGRGKRQESLGTGGRYWGALVTRKAWAVAESEGWSPALSKPTWGCRRGGTPTITHTPFLQRGLAGLCAVGQEQLSCVVRGGRGGGSLRFRGGGRVHFREDSSLVWFWLRGHTGQLDSGTTPGTAFRNHSCLIWDSRD